MSTTLAQLGDIECKVFQHATEHMSHNCLETYTFTMRNTIIEDKLTNMSRKPRQDDRDAPTALTLLALCHRVILDSVAH